jgi:hypothetical protein
MRYVSVFAAMLILLAFVSVPAGAGVTSTGMDPEATSIIILPDAVAQPDGCDILWFGLEYDVARLTGLGFNITTTVAVGDLSLANLQNYDVLVIAYTGPGVAGSAQSDIEQFVNGGGGFLTHQPDATGTTDYAPTGFEVTIDDVFWCGGGTFEQAMIVNGPHPITSGLADADLSGDFDLVGSIGGGYTVLAENIECGDPALAVGTYGCGRVVFDTGNAVGFDPGSDEYWLNLFEWLCEAEPCMYLDIHPTSCPNPLSMKKQGVIPAAILGTETFDVTTIDPATLLLEGVAPIRWNRSDVAAPYTGDLCGCGTDGPDGYMDLTLKFAAPLIREALGPIAPGDVVTLTLTGMLMDGTPFEARDCMIIRGKPAAPSLATDPASDPDGDRDASWGRIKSMYRR